MSSPPWNSALDATQDNDDDPWVAPMRSPRQTPTQQPGERRQEVGLVGAVGPGIAGQAGDAEPETQDIFCEICDVWLNGLTQYEDHKTRKKHKKNLRKQSKLDRERRPTGVDRGDGEVQAEGAEDGSSSARAPMRDATD